MKSVPDSLGAEQSGQIAAVGFELYCDLLKESVARLGQRQSDVVRPVPVDLDRLVFAAEDRTGRSTAVLILLACAGLPPPFSLRAGS